MSGEPLTLNYLIRMMLPFTTRKFWFVNSYIALYLLSPFINKLIYSLTKKQFSVLVILLISMFSSRVTFLPITWSQDTTGGMGILSFLTLYCMAAWLRLYYRKKSCAFKYLVIYIVISFLLPISKKVMLMVGFSEGLSGKLYGYSSFLVYAEAVALFLAFLNAKPIIGKLSKCINAVAKHSFSVYIIHFAMVGVLFTDILHVDCFVGNVVTGVAAVLSAVIIVYAFCTCVDIVKYHFAKKIDGQIAGTRVVQKYMKLVEYWDGIVN